VTSPVELRDEARRARRDADDLRRQAAALDASHLRALPALAGDRTWVGPMADQFQDEVRRSVAEITDAAAELRAHALRLDQHASDLDHAAARAELLIGS
jgi:hypothetical protein